jgi:hypothetical protein
MFPFVSFPFSSSLHRIASLLVFIRFPNEYVLRSRPKRALKQTQWLESASELHRPSGRRLSAKFVPNLQIESATWST